MTDKNQTEAQLIQELARLRQRVAELEAAESKHQQLEDIVGERTTELTHAIEQLQHNEERLTLAIVGTGGALWDEQLDPDAPFDKQSGTMYYSLQEQHLLGYTQTAEHPNGGHLAPRYEAWYDHIFPEDRAVVEQRQREHFAGRTAYLDHEYRVQLKDGSIRWIHGRSRIIRDDRGRPIRWIGIDWDITEHKQATEELEKYRENLEELVAERTAELEQEIAEREQAEATVHKRGEMLTILYHAGQQFSQTLDTQIIFQGLYEWVTKLMPCDGLFISSFTPEDNLIRCIFAVLENSPLDAEQFPPITLAPGGMGIQSIVIRNGHPLLITDYQSYLGKTVTAYHVEKTGTLSDLEQTPEQEPITQSALLVPMRLAGKTVGVIQVMSFQKNAFTEEHQQLLESLSSQVTVAFNNALLYQQAQAEITDRKQAEKERERLTAQLREQAQQMAQVLATVPAGVLLLDAEGQLLQANPVAENHLATLTDAQIGDTLIYLGDRSLAELLLPPPTEGLWHEVTAHRRTFEVIARPIEQAPKPEHWVLVFNDVTQEREIQAQLQQQERLAAVGQLAAGIAHDFNNIMAVIVLYAQMAARAQGLAERDRERMEIINQQAQHATQLITQILDFSRRAVLERRPLDLHSLLKEQIRLLKRTLPEHIEMDWQSGTKEYVINADSTRMQQMLTNLAVNARDAMPNGGILRIELTRITIESNQSTPLPEMTAGEWVCLTISDTGTGISSDVLPHIFDPFFTTKQAGEGSGLGLAQVYGIVGQHGGYIDVETQMDEGTTFTIYLPALATHKPQFTAPDVSVTSKGQGESILVVEDEATLRGALTEILDQLNYQVLEATNGQEALAIMDTQGDQIALVLSDVIMPKMGGIALFQALREREQHLPKPTPVILLTGHPMDKELNLLRDEGLSAWLLKPPDFEQLSQALARALGE